MSKKAKPSTKRSNPSKSQQQGTRPLKFCALPTVAEVRAATLVIAHAQLIEIIRAEDELCERLALVLALAPKGSALESAVKKTDRPLDQLDAALDGLRDLVAYVAKQPLP